VHQSSLRFTNPLLLFAAFIIIIAGLKTAASIIVPFLLALFITIMVLPLFNYLSAKMHSVIALIITLAAIFSIVSILSSTVTASLNHFSQNLPIYQDQLSTKLAPFESTLKAQGFDLAEFNIYENINPNSVLKYALKFLESIGNVLGNILTILFIVIFMLLEVKLFSNKFDTIVTDNEHHKQLERVFENITKYFVYKTIFSALTGLLVYVGLLLIGVDSAPLWAIIAFGLNFIPTIGSIVAAIPAVLLAFVQFDLSAVMFVITLYVSVNVIVGSIIEPKVMGSGLGISTLVVFLSLMFWGYVFGTMGMLLSVPLTIMAKIALDVHPSTKPFAIMLSDHAGETQSVSLKQA
jgi:predicted PurR-regulated permease PerM